MREVYPYETLGGDVALLVGDIEIDGQAAPTWAENEGRQIDLSHPEKAGWKSLRVPVTVMGPPTELEARAKAGGAPRAHVVVQCGFTNARQSVALAPDGDGNRWIGDLEMDRRFWFGRVEVAAFITDEVDGRRRMVGWADRWSILLDDFPDSPVRGALTVKWRNFDDKETDPPSLAAAKGEPYFHLIDPNQPVLYLNSAFPGLEPLLGNRSGRRDHSEQALHDQVRSMIATKFFLGAANAALAGVEVDEDGGCNWPQSEWQRELLEALLHRAFPKRAAADALEEVMALRRTDDGAGIVENLLITAVDRHVGAARLLKLSIRNLGTDAAETVQEQPI